MSSSNLQTWLQGDGFWFITFGAIALGGVCFQPLFSILLLHL